MARSPSRARSRRKVARIGVLSPFAASDGPAPSFQVFRDTLRELGHTEGETVSFEYRWAGGKYDRLPALAAELAQSKVDVIVSAWSTPAALAAKRATATIPVVFVGVGAAVGVELVTSLVRSGGHVTGSTFLSEETVGKLLQLLKEVVPRAARVAVSLQVVRLGIQGPAHKILKGAKAADLPVEQSSRFELVVNMKTARTLGVRIPDPVLLRADQVLE